MAVLGASLGLRSRRRSPLRRSIVGSLGNFDVVNDNQEMEGFEIQLEDVDVADFPRVLGSAA